MPARCRPTTSASPMRCNQASTASRTSATRRLQKVLDLAFLTEKERRELAI